MNPLVSLIVAPAPGMEGEDFNFLDLTLKGGNEVMLMKIASNIAGVLLGLLFILASVMVLFNLAPAPKLEPGTPVALFMGAFAPTGYLTFVKICELVGGILVAIPLTRNLGLLVLGPILVNILAFHIFITKGADLANPMIILIVVLTAFLLWSGRRAFAGLVR